MSSSTDDSSSSSSESSSGETKQFSRTSSRPERSSQTRLQRKSRSRSRSREPSKINRGLPGHFPGQDCRDQGHQQVRGKEENRPETRGISACVIV